mmetsp:Transcript_114573/g.370191  ORF Transcript_114573/g.370191 Transcript_114573/m.370191 type:complete len:445 (+) Transcript_114573:461-1795(+)
MLRKELWHADDGQAGDGPGHRHQHGHRPPVHCRGGAGDAPREADDVVGDLHQHGHHAGLRRELAARGPALRRGLARDARLRARAAAAGAGALADGHAGVPAVARGARPRGRRAGGAAPLAPRGRGRGGPGVRDPPRPANGGGAQAPRLGPAPLPRRADAEDLGRGCGRGLRSADQRLGEHRAVLAGGLQASRGRQDCRGPLPRHDLRRLREDALHRGLRLLPGHGGPPAVADPQHHGHGAVRVAAGAGADGGGQPLLRRRLPALPGAACSGHPGVHLRWHRDHRPREAGGLRLRPWHPPGRGGQLLAEARGRGRPIHDRLPHGQVCEDSAARQSRQGGHAGGGEDPAAAGLQPAQGGGLGGGAGLADERALRHPAAQPLPVHPGDHAGDLRELPLRRRGRADALAERRARRRLPGACAGRGQPGGDLGRAGRHLAGHLGHRPAG